MTSSKPGWDYSNTHRLFVYGSLTDAGQFVRIAGERFTVIGQGQEPPRNGLFAIDGVLEGYEKWKPRDRYPAGKRQIGDKLGGFLIFRVTRPMMQLLDDYEGDRYTRRSVIVATAIGPMEAECYLALRDIPPQKTT
jgi:hypothetical protein